MSPVEKRNMETDGNDIPRRAKQLFGLLGLVCLFLIILIKAARFVFEASTGTLMMGIAPSLLGPAGFLFLFLSGSGKVGRLKPARAAIIVTVVALVVEFAQLLPRPGLLAMVYYTFDWLDVFASVLSVALGYTTVVFVRKRYHAPLKG